MFAHPLVTLLMGELVACDVLLLQFVLSHRQLNDPPGEPDFQEVHYCSGMGNLSLNCPDNLKLQCEREKEPL